MASITIIVGLPGSGKTTLAKAMALESSAVLWDDISISGLPPSAENSEIIITDALLCLSEKRRELSSILGSRFPERVECWLFFENRPEKCLANIHRRATHDPRPLEALMADLKFLARRYIIPEGASMHPVWQEPAQDRSPSISSRPSLSR